MHQPNRTVASAFFFTLLVVVTLAFLGLLQVFLEPLFWAATLAILFNPLQERFATAMGGRRRLAAAATLIVIVLAVLLPLMLVGFAVVREAANLIAQIQEGNLDIGSPMRWLEQQLPALDTYLQRFNIDIERLREGLSAAALTSGQWIAGRALAIGQNALRFTVMLVLMLYLLFFFLRDGRRILDGIVRALPMGDERERDLMSRFAQVSRAAIKGTFIIGAVQGAIGGITFWALGIQGAVLWGVVMALLSLLPVGGSGIVWVPAAIILAVSGEFIRALILVVVGSLIIGLVDNLLRPMLVGRDTRMPDFLILLSTLGGLTVFGLSGFVIGPIIAALFLTVWGMFQEEYNEDPSARGSGTPPAGKPRST
ncbi:MAG TPA: AI-2E family transporter [Gammaproteobacteria bacterium]|nr:AI-2E family transporter [Gammaproteobacteria bacterium]